MTSRVGKSMRVESLLVYQARGRVIRAGPAPCFLMLQAFVFFSVVLMSFGFLAG